MNNFGFLQAEWPELHESATRAEGYLVGDPRTACFHARRALELAVTWLYRHETALRLPYQETLSALVYEPTFKATAGEAIFQKAALIIRQGNQAVHGRRAVSSEAALACVRELHHVCYWLARTYARGSQPPETLRFTPPSASAPGSASTSPQTQAQLAKLAEELAAKDAQLRQLFVEKEQTDAELAKVRAEITEAKRRNAATPDAHDYSEAQTRDAFIDVLLQEAGWPFADARDREYEVDGMPNGPGKGYVDYVLWGADGRPLALIEAKKTRKSAQIGQQQAKLYADCLEKRFGRRPAIFYTNGYEHWLWDDACYPPRRVQGFYKRDELELLLGRRTTRASLAAASIDAAIVERYYQTRAIRRIGEAFERDHERKALVVMATGAGKTRTVIALCDLLMRCNWVKRVLFLADRVALVNQAVNAFKKHLPSSSPVNLVTEKTVDGRVFVSTYPSMMGLIEETADGQRRFGVGHFDLVVIDEAHRSVYQKYAAIFRYFDSLLVGLTATPRSEVDRDTYGLFELEKGVPTDAYELRDAVSDGFLVPAKAVSVPLKFPREGIRYDDLSEEEQAEWDEKEWDDDSGPPNNVAAEAVNKWLFNEDTVDRALAHLMTHGLKVAGGDRLGKTIIFAKNQAHAEFIAQRFDANYPHLKGAFARVIHCQLPYAQSIIDDFSQAARAPHIAISVDMLDTGIDVPEVVNLLFFKPVRSKTKFWQMVGRGTRLCPELFGPNQPKTCFYIFDYCQNLEFFSENPEATEGSLGASLGRRLFQARLELIGELEKPEPDTLAEMPSYVRELGGELRALLHREVAAMNINNFVVRPHRRLVERFLEKTAWNELSTTDATDLARDVAGLPAELDAEDEEAKRFDLLLLRLQLAVLRKEPSFERLSKQVIEIAGLLEEKASIPMVKAQLAHIQEIQTGEWWEHITVPMLEQTRKRLRDLVRFIEKKRRKPIYTDFEDELGTSKEIEFDEFAGSDSFEKFRDKARAFLRAHQDNLAVHKLRMNEPLTNSDIAELERVLGESGVGRPEHLTQAKTECAGLGIFVRSLVGLDREAAKRALGGFFQGKKLNANQLEFVNLIVEQLTAQGVMEARALYNSPFTDIAPQGPESLFGANEIEALFATLETVKARAVA